MKSALKESRAPRTLLVLVVLSTAFVTLLLVELLFRTLAPEWSDQWKMWRIDPIHAIGLQPNLRNATVHGVSKEFVFQFSTNAQGLRMDYDLSVEKLPGSRRILLVGDSFTFGYGVQQNEAFPAELQRLLDPDHRRIEVINAGFASGFTLDTEYLFTREVGAKWHPDLVLVGVSLSNDLDDLRTTTWRISEARLASVRKLNEYVPLWLKRSGLVNLLVKGAWPRIQSLIARPRTVKAQREPNSACSLPDEPYRPPPPTRRASQAPPELKLSAENWSEKEKADWVAKAWAHDADAKRYRLGLLLIPDREEVQGTFSEGKIRHLQFIRSVFSRAAESAGLEILDPTLDMRRTWCQTGEGLYFDVDGHWNANGHCFIAAWLARRVSATLSELSVTPSGLSG
jgi:hypothetical protein